MHFSTKPSPFNELAHQLYYSYFNQIPKKTISRLIRLLKLTNSVS